MISPHGYAVSRDALRSAPTLPEAVALMPEAPPRCSDIELLRRFEQAYRWWRSDILWPALARERAGLHDRIDIDDRPQAGGLSAGGDVAAAAGAAGQEPAAAGALPGARSDAAGLLGAAAPGAARGGDRDAGRAVRSVPAILTTEEVAALARVGVATVRRAVHETRAGLRGPGSPWYLPRAYKVRAGFLRDDVLRWLEARGQIRGGGQAHQSGLDTARCPEVEITTVATAATPKHRRAG
jgi:hypothetical protein